MKVQQKTSGTFRSWAGADAFALIRSYLSTIRKRGMNVIDAIAAVDADHPSIVVTVQNSLIQSFHSINPPITCHEYNFSASRHSCWGPSTAAMFFEPWKLNAPAVPSEPTPSPCHWAPCACAQSSTTCSRRRSASAWNPSMSAGWPARTRPASESSRARLAVRHVAEADLDARIPCCRDGFEYLRQHLPLALAERDCLAGDWNGCGHG